MLTQNGGQKKTLTVILACFVYVRTSTINHKNVTIKSVGVNSVASNPLTKIKCVCDM